MQDLFNIDLPWASSKAYFPDDLSIYQFNPIQFVNGNRHP